MSSKYFKYRTAFQPKVHPYDLGVLTGLKRGSDDNHFLLKVYKLDASAFEAYYLYHLKYYLEKDERNNEHDFFVHVWRIVEKRIEYFEGRDPFSSKHALYVSNTEKLRAFQEFLAPRDKWHIRPNELLLMEKDHLIAELREKIGTLEKNFQNWKNLKYPSRRWYRTTIFQLLLTLSTN